MKRYSRFLRPLTTASLSAAAWAQCAGTAWAWQAASPAAGNKSYALAYLLVVLVIALGLAIVLGPSGRSTDIKPKAKD